MKKGGPRDNPACFAAARCPASCAASTATKTSTFGTDAMMLSSDGLPGGRGNERKQFAFNNGEWEPMEFSASRGSAHRLSKSTNPEERKNREMTVVSPNAEAISHEGRAGAKREGDFPVISARNGAVSGSMLTGRSRLDALGGKDDCHGLIFVRVVQQE